jgi:hypothetical protein
MWDYSGLNPILGDVITSRLTELATAWLIWLMICYLPWTQLGAANIFE